jgi:hypothetical protein
VAIQALILNYTKGRFGGKKLYIYLKKILFFSFILNVGLEAYMELYVYGMITVTSRISTLNGDVIG